jgi:hypothetical protein
VFDVAGVTGTVEVFAAGAVVGTLAGVCTGTCEVAGAVVLAGAEPGIWFAGLAGAGVVTGAVTAAPSKTLPVELERLPPKYVNNSVLTKNTAAKIDVVRDKKLALPLAPNKLPEPPLPNAAPMSAPLPC